MCVSLTNTSRRCLVFVLAHETYCNAVGKCQCNITSGRSTRRTAKSLTLPSGVTSQPLNEAVLAVADIVRAAKRGYLRVDREASEPRNPIAPLPPIVASTSADARGSKPKAQKRGES